MEKDGGSCVVSMIEDGEEKLSNIAIQSFGFLPQQVTLLTQTER